MDNSNYSKNRYNEHLGVNKFGKNIKKQQPPPQPNYGTRPQSQSQPQVYKINKNDFRNVVQQLTGSPSHHSQEPLLPNPQPPPPKSPSLRLQRIRPPPMNINRPQTMVQNGLMGPVPVNDRMARPVQYGQPPPPSDHHAESPVSAYMRYLQHSVNDPMHSQQSSGLLPNPTGPPPVFASPRNKGYPSLLPSPTSQFLLPSPYALLSPGYQHPPPFSPVGQPGILGPGPRSPGFFPLSSPRWRD